MEIYYVILLVSVICFSIITAFKTGYDIGVKSAVSLKAPEENKIGFVESVKDFIVDTVSSFVKKGEIEEPEIERVETEDGRFKDSRKFF